MQGLPMEPSKAFANTGVSEYHRWSLADSLTAARIAGSILLLFPLDDSVFLTIYTLAGITDALDGWLARKSGTASDFGARLDSWADLSFYGVLLYRLFPVLWQRMPVEIWYAVAMIVLIRLGAYITAAIRFHRFAALHTWLNKLTGAAVFGIPYVLAASSGIGYCWIVCILAFASSLEELLMHLCRRDYCASRKSIFSKGEM